MITVSGITPSLIIIFVNIIILNIYSNGVYRLLDDIYINKYTPVIIYSLINFLFNMMLTCYKFIKITNTSDNLVDEYVILLKLKYILMCNTAILILIIILNCKYNYNPIQGPVNIIIICGIIIFLNNLYVIFFVFNKKDIVNPIVKNIPNTKSLKFTTLSNNNILYTRIKYDSTTCIICLENYKQEEDISLLKCEHIFHTSCINEWFSTRDTCPSCKHSSKEN